MSETLGTISDNGGVDQRLHIGFHRNIGTDKMSILAQPVCQGLSGFLPSGHNHYPGAFLHKQLCESGVEIIEKQPDSG